jgi:hypothetical protein
VPPKSDPQSDHEPATYALRLAQALEAIAADRERRDMTSLRECVLTRRLKEQPADDALFPELREPVSIRRRSSETQSNVSRQEPL